MLEIMTTNCMVIQMQIGLEVSQTKESHQVDVISWFSKKRSNVSLSMAEEKYIAAYSASCESIWIWKLMSGLFNLELDTTVILCDNQIYINITENSVFHDKSSTYKSGISTFEI